MKRVIAIGLTALACMNIGFCAEDKFTDVEVNSWYEKATIRLSDEGIIKGFPDSTFRPFTDLNGDQFITMVLRSVLNEDIKSDEGYWASGSINRAIELGLISEGDYRNPISREEMSAIIIKALEIKGEEIPSDVSKIENVVKDSDLFTDSNDIPAYQCYEMGIITGYPDYTFGPQNTLTRAEASTVILRLIDKDARKPFDYEALNEKINNPIASKMPGGVDYINPLDVSPEVNKTIDATLMSDLLAEKNNLKIGKGSVGILGHGKRGVNGDICYYFGPEFSDYYKNKYNKDPDKDSDLVQQYIDEQRVLFERLMRRRGVDETTIDEVIKYVSQKNSTSWKANLSMEEETSFKPWSMSDEEWESYLKMSLPKKRWESNGYEIIINDDDHLRTMPHLTQYNILKLEDKE